jgi:hypothetical protein
VLDASCNALVCGEFAESSVPPIHSRSYDSSKKMLQKMWETGAGQNVFAADGTYHDYISGMFTYCNNRALCTTEQGLIALAPKAAQPGHQDCVLLDGQSPILLRPAGDTQWQVVGERYVQGLMAGEALGRPLPENYRLVNYQLRILSLPMHCFQNIATGGFLLHDPRFDVSDYPEES